MSSRVFPAKRTSGTCYFCEAGICRGERVFFMLAHDLMYRVHGKWLNMSVDKFDTIHYSGMALFKLGLFMFNLVPYFALRIIG